MDNRRRGALYGALIGDAFALGAHWIYDTSVIARHFADVRTFHEPLTSYHPGKRAGDYTHYGDQALHLHNFLRDQPQATAVQYGPAWLSYIRRAPIYKDHASKDSIERLATGLVGADNSELGGVAITIPALLSDVHDLAAYLDILHLTHNDDVLDNVAKFSRDWLSAALHGENPQTWALKLLDDHPVTKSLLTFEPNNTTRSATEAIAAIGQACPVAQSFPASLYIVLKHGDDFLTAMQANIAAGGDSAARGMYIGMILGAALGFDGLPQNLLADLNHRPD